MALAATDVVTWATTAWLAGLPLAIGAAVLRYRLYDLERIVSRTVDAFAARLREQVDLDALSAEVLAVVDQTMQPTMASLWLWPQSPEGAANAIVARQRT